MSDPGSYFPSTVWSQIRPGEPGADGSSSAAAIDALARRYSRPIRAYVGAALGKGPDEAADLAQDFFVWMMETSFLAKADPARGKFRTFLKTALRHYAADEDRKRTALRRGGDRRAVPIDSEERAAEAPDPDAPSPDDALDRAYRAEVVHQALERVETRLRGEGKEAVFAVFRDYFLDPGEGADYRAIAASRGLSTAEVSNHLQKAKALYRSALKSIVIETVRTAEELEEELFWLFGRSRGRSPDSKEAT